MIRKGKILFVLFILCLSIVSPAYAHADLVRSNPAPGSTFPIGSLTQITLDFDEVIEPNFSSIEVYNSNLERVDDGIVQADPLDRHVLHVNLLELKPDLYTVVWVVVSTVDGHSTSGLFNFSVGKENEEIIPSENLLSSSSEATLSPWEIIIRWLLYSASFMIFGAFLLGPTILQPGHMAQEAEHKKFWANIDQSVNKLVLRAIILWILTNFVLLGWQSSIVGRLGLVDAFRQGIPLQLLRTRFGMVWLLRQIFAFVLIILHRRNQNQHNVIKLLLAAALFFTLSLSSHNAAGALWPTISILIGWLHLLANGAWIGGLLILVMAFIPRLPLLSEQGKSQQLKFTLQRFSILAIGSVLLAAGTGFFSATLHILTLEDLVQTPYGGTLLLKFALVILVLFFGLANLLSFKTKGIPRMPQFQNWLNNWRGKMAQWLKMESLLGLLILVTTAYLTTLPTPPPQLIPEGKTPFKSELREIDLIEEDIKVFLSIAPNYIGWNRYLIVLHDGIGTPISDAERVRVRFYLPTADARTEWLVAESSPDGLYVTSGWDLLLVGEWQIEIDIRRQNTDDVRFTTNWAMDISPIYLVDPDKPRPENWMALAFLGLIFGGLFFWRWMINRPKEYSI